MSTKALRLPLPILTWDTVRRGRTVLPFPAGPPTGSKPQSWTQIRSSFESQMIELPGPGGRLHIMKKLSSLAGVRDPGTPRISLTPRWDRNPGT
jgi:hypothetical protein